MGVSAGFSKWLQQIYDEAFTPAYKHGAFDHVYVDVNNILHVAARWGGGVSLTLA